MKFNSKYNNPILKFPLFLVICFIFPVACQHQKTSDTTATITAERKSDLETIKQSGTLRAVVDYNSTNYFVYRGRPMGFQYELLQHLCEDLNVNLEILVSNNLAETFDGLNKGRYDLIAKNLTITKQREKQVDFTEPLQQTVQVLVQREKSKNANDSVFIDSAIKLANKKVYVQKNTSYYRRLQNLSEEIGKNIFIEEDTIYGVEQLVARVARGEIDYTICDENVAKLNQTYFPNLDISVKVSFTQNLAWAVRSGSNEWKTYLDAWIVSFIKTRKYRQIYHRYFESSRISSRMDSEYHSISGGKISKYDKQIQTISAEYNWDWRLISSIIYHESRFNADAVSWAGAYGLMQVMPSTAKSLGVENFKQPKHNIEAGILLLNWLNNQFLESIPDSTERIKFVLASYNIGLGHVKDAQRLAEKYEKEKTKWENNVDYYLLNKSTEKYYKDPVVRWGYARGEEAYNYVNKVIHNYEHYLNVIPK